LKTKRIIFVLLLGLAFLLLASQLSLFIPNVKASPAHTFDTKYQGARASTNPYTFSYTCGAGTTLFVLSIVVGGTTARAGGAPTYNSVAMTQADTVRSSTETKAELWYLLSPPTGSSLQVSIPNTGAVFLSPVASSYKAASGCASALRTANGGTGTSTNPTGPTLTGLASGDVIIAVVGTGANAWAPTARTGTQLYDRDDGAYGNGAQYLIKTDATDVAMGWTFGTSDDWAICEAAFKETITITLATTPLTSCNVRLDSGTWYTAPHAFTELTPGSSHSIEAQDPYVVTANQEQYIWASWSDSGANPHSVTPTSDTTYTATMTHQWYFLVSSTYDSPTGTGWYNTGSSCSGSNVTRPVSGGATTQYETTGWTGTGSLSSGGTVGSSSTGSFTINAYSTCTWNWKTQYLVTITSSGIGVDSSGTVATLGGNDKTQAQLPYSQWFDASSSVSYAFSSPVSTSDSNKRYVWSSTSYTGTPAQTLQSNTFTITGGGTLTGTYGTQWQVTITSSGIGVDTSGTVATLDGDAKTQAQLPYAKWLADSYSLAYAFSSPVSATAGKQYVWTSTSGLSQTLQTNTFSVTAGGTITGTYNTQYYFTVTSSYGSPTGEGWYDSGTTTVVSTIIRPQSGGAGIRYETTGWTGTGSLSSGGTYGSTTTGTFTIDAVSTCTWNWITQYQPTITLTGTTSSLTISITIRTLNGSSNTPSGLYTSWSDWCDSGTTLTFSDVNTGGGSATERLHTVSTRSWTVSSAFSATITYIYQWKPTITLTGTTSSLTTSITVRTLDGSSNTPSGLYTSWTDWCDDSTTLTFSDVNTGGGSGTERLHTISTRSWTVTSALTATITYVHQWSPTITLSGTTSSLTVSITVRTLDGSSATASGLYTSWSNWCDDSTTLTFSTTNTGGGSSTERLHIVSTVSWSVTSAFSATITYIHQWKPTITLTGTTSSLTVSITVRTLDGSSNTPSGLYTSWTDWCDDSTTLTFSTSNTGGGSSTERIHTTGTVSWSITSALSQTITYIHQWKPSITLGGTLSEDTVDITARTLDGSSATASGLYTSWNDWCDDSTTLTFSATSTSGKQCRSTTARSWTVSSAFSATPIWDRMKVSSYSVSDSRANINDNVNIDATLVYEYDNAQVTTGTITINSYSASYQGSGVYRITRTSVTVTSVNYNTVAGSETTYGLSTVNQNSQSTTVIWDRIEIYAKDDPITVQNVPRTESLPSETLSMFPSSILIFALSFLLLSFSRKGNKRPKILCSILILLFLVPFLCLMKPVLASDKSVPVDTYVVIWFKARYDYDNASYTNQSSSTLSINGTLATYNVTGDYWQLNVTQSVAGNYTYLVTAISDGVYGLTTFYDAVGAITVYWSSGYALNLHIMDYDLTDVISGASVYKDSDVKTSDSNGWANWTLVTGTVQIQVKYFGYWVNGTSVTMDSDKTINLKCNLFDVTINCKETVQNASLSNVNVTVYNSTNAKIKSGITNSNGQVSLTNLPNNTLTFTQYGGASYIIVIGNTTQSVSNENQSFTITANQNYVNTNNNYSIIAFVGMTIPFKSSFITKRLKRKIYKKRKKKRNK